MENQSAIIELTPSEQADIAIITAEQWQADDITQEQFDRYTRAADSGIIDKLVDYTHQHGTPERDGESNEDVCRWIISRDQLTLEAKAFPDGSLVVRRNGEVIMDDGNGAEMVFDAGQGHWIKTMLIEHKRLERDEQQKSRLAARSDKLEADRRRNRNI